MTDDPQQHVTIREFEGFKEAVVNAISDSSTGIHKRLDGTDRRIENVQRTTNDLLRVSGEHATKLGEHERRLNGHRHARKDDRLTGDNDPVTVKDVKRALWIAGGMASALTAIVKGLPMLLKAIQP